MQVHKVKRKEEVENNMSRCNNVVSTDNNARVKYDESTAVSILYYHSVTAKDTIQGDL
jgi:hypothetical protein